MRRAAVAALLAAIAQPVTMFIQMLVLLGPLTGTLGANMVSVYVRAREVIGALFFASAAWVVAFALEAGRRKQDELAGYV